MHSATTKPLPATSSLGAAALRQFPAPVCSLTGQPGPSGTLKGWLHEAPHASYTCPYSWGGYIMSRNLGCCCAQPHSHVSTSMQQLRPPTQDVRGGVKGANRRPSLRAPHCTLQGALSGATLGTLGGTPGSWNPKGTRTGRPGQRSVEDPVMATAALRARGHTCFEAQGLGFP